jgi:hypothetical protein
MHCCCISITLLRGSIGRLGPSVADGLSTFILGVIQSPCQVLTRANSASDHSTSRSTCRC